MHEYLICMSVLFVVAQERLDILNPLGKLAWISFLRLSPWFFVFFFPQKCKNSIQRTDGKYRCILLAFPPPILMICLVQIYYSFHQNFQHVCSHACQESYVLPVHFCTIMNLIREKRVLEHQ